ncbi:MAG: hypothetical protein HKN68_01375 [Saprospiraceae bacterium]|nr:hypothetical protein [Saprospiraceae bacterium]
MKEIIEILEVKSFGFIVKNHTRKIKQVLPRDYVKKRISWGLYEIINGGKFQLT